jgi:putative tributyrin esterase
LQTYCALKLYASRVRRESLLLLLLLISLGCAKVSHPPLQTRNQQVIKHDNSVTITDVHLWSDSLDAMFWYRVIVPAHEPTQQLPVLYLLHGANSGPDEIMARSPIVDLATAEHLIVVMPEASTSYYTNAQHIQHARWEDVITHDLPSDVVAHFPVLQARQFTGIAGISMGGYGAIKLALKHPGLYSFVGDMSAPLDITRRPPALQRWTQTTRTWSIFGYLPSTRRNEDVFALLSSNPPAHDLRWFASCGKSDPLEPVNQRFVNDLRKQGANISLIQTPGGHDWQSWNTVMPRLLRTAAQALHDQAQAPKS